DAALGIDAAIVRTVVALAFILLGQDGDSTRLHVGANHPTAARALLAAFATDQSALGIEAIAIRAATIGAERGDYSLGVHFEDAIAGYIAEEDVARGIDRGAFEEADNRCRCGSRALAHQSVRQGHTRQLLTCAERPG